MALKTLIIFILVALTSCRFQARASGKVELRELENLIEVLPNSSSFTDLEKSHSSTTVHSEVQISASVSYDFGSERDSDQTVQDLKVSLIKEGYKVLMLSSTSQGFGKMPGQIVGVRSWYGHRVNYFDPAVTRNHYIGEEGDPGRKKISKRLRITGLLEKNGCLVMLHLWLFPGQQKCYAVLSSTTGY